MHYAKILASHCHVLFCFLCGVQQRAHCPRFWRPKDQSPDYTLRSRGMVQGAWLGTHQL